MTKEEFDNLWADLVDRIHNRIDSVTRKEFV